MADKVTPEHVEHPDGSHSIGVTLDGVFLPFWTIDAVTVADRVQALKELQAAETDEKAKGAGK